MLSAGVPVTTAKRRCRVPGAPAATPARTRARSPAVEPAGRRPALRPAGAPAASPARRPAATPCAREGAARSRSALVLRSLDRDARGSGCPGSARRRWSGPSRTATTPGDGGRAWRRGHDSHLKPPAPTVSASTLYPDAERFGAWDKSRVLQGRRSNPISGLPEVALSGLRRSCATRQRLPNGIYRAFPFVEAGARAASAPCRRVCDDGMVAGLAVFGEGRSVSRFGGDDGIGRDGCPRHHERPPWQRRQGSSERETSRGRRELDRGGSHGCSGPGHPRPESDRCRG